jgi:hypothetical protein
VEAFGFHTYDAERFAAASRDFCSLPHATLLARAREGAYAGASIARLEGQCFKAAWIYHWLHDGLGFPRAEDNDPTYEHEGDVWVWVWVGRGGGMCAFDARVCIYAWMRGCPGTLMTMYIFVCVCVWVRAYVRGCVRAWVRGWVGGCRTPQVIIADTIDGVPVSWTLGALLVWTLGALLVLLAGQQRGDLHVHGPLGDALTEAGRGADVGWTDDAGTHGRPARVRSTHRESVCVRHHYKRLTTQGVPLHTNAHRRLLSSCCFG